MCGKPGAESEDGGPGAAVDVGDGREGRGGAEVWAEREVADGQADGSAVSGLREEVEIGVGESVGPVVLPLGNRGVETDCGQGGGHGVELTISAGGGGEHGAV